MTNQSLLVSELKRFALMLVTDYPVSDALHDFVQAAAAILDIHAVGMSLVSDGRLSFATASLEEIAALERAQEEGQAGPGVDAFRSKTALLIPDISKHAAQWPYLAHVAASSGIVAVAAIPLAIDAHDLGALDLYDTRRRDWTGDEAEVAELLAALAAGYLANSTRLGHARTTADQLQEALDSRVVIEQAKGVIAGERGISVDEAFDIIRAHARKRGAPMRDVANAIVHLGLRP